MTPPTSPDPPAAVGDARAAVRRNALWAAGAAAIMLWYGFRNIQVDESAVTAGERVFVYALQIGGVLMAVSALFSLTGVRAALLFDGAASLLIGLALLAAAGLMVSGNGSFALMLVLFGVVFLHSGYRNCDEFRTLRPPASPIADSDVPPA